MIKDKAIAWNVKRLFRAVQDMAGWDATQAAALGAGAAIYQEPVAAAQLAGLQVGAAGDAIHDLLKIPYDLDRDMPLAARIWFSHGTTDTDDPDWLVTLKGLGLEALTASTATPDASLTFPALAVAATADAMEKTSWQKTSSGIFVSTDVFLNMAVECNGLGSAGANEITLWGIELAYTVKATGDSQMRDTTLTSLEGRSLY